MLLKDLMDKIKFYFIKTILKIKKSNSEKIIYYLKHEDMFFKKFNKKEKILIEYGSVLELLKICDKIEELKKKKDVNILPKIPEDTDIYTLELFYSFENSYIENIREINSLLLKKILDVYQIDKEFVRIDYKFFSKSIQPHIIVLEKYLNTLFNSV